VLWRTGHRLGEIVYHPSGEINYLTRSSLSIRKANGRTISQPTPDDWRQLRAGDCVLLAPCVSKADQFGQEHCPFPSILPYNGDLTCAAAAVRDIELEQPCAADARRSTPLFGDERQKPFTYAVLHGELRRLLAALFGVRMAGVYSWHSFRIGLACALASAGCPDSHIQLICRWASPASLHTYRQLGVEQNVVWTDRAQTATFDATRVNNLPALDMDDALASNIATFDGDGGGVGVATPAPLPRRAPVQTFSIPGGTVQASEDDSNGIVGNTYGIFNHFWPGYATGWARTRCPVVARCVRDFNHPDGQRTLTYLIEWNHQHWPIKHSGLIGCMTRDERAALPRQRV